ncbi:MAG: hypothetical protein PHY48_15435 [Candidatus Cloacimonetes bacterium]|nr:hypothetical protein [Candidatus Cloacimonadota bacterium]
MIKLLYYVFAGLILIASEASATNWVEYFHSAADTRSYIDTNSIVRLPNSNIRAWNKFHGSNGNGNLTLMEVDCKQRKYTIRDMRPLDPDNVKFMATCSWLVKDWSEPTQKWDYIDTSDGQEALYNRWCKGK